MNPAQRQTCRGRRSRRGVRLNGVSAHPASTRASIVRARAEPARGPRPIRLDRAKPAQPRVGRALDGQPTWAPCHDALRLGDSPLHLDLTPPPPPALAQPQIDGLGGPAPQLPALRGTPALPRPATAPPRRSPPRRRRPGQAPEAVSGGRVFSRRAAGGATSGARGAWWMRQLAAAAGINRRRARARQFMRRASPAATASSRRGLSPTGRTYEEPSPCPSARARRSSQPYIVALMTFAASS